MQSLLSRRAWVASIGFGLLLLLPLGAQLGATPYAVNLATRFLIYGLAAVSLDLILGYGYLVSFGHAMFFGLGGYVAAIITYHALEAGPLLGWAGSTQALVVWPIALLCCGLLGAAVGYLALRTRGVQFIMITLAFAQLVYFVLMSLQIYGGDDGLMMQQRNTLPGLNLDAPNTFYYLCLAALAVWTFVCARIVNSRFGMVLQALRQSERRAVNLGAAPTPYRLGAFVLSAIRAPASHFSVMSPKVLAAVSRRFSRCFSCAGERPSEMARRASTTFSRARARDRPAGPYRPNVNVSRRPFSR